MVTVTVTPSTPAPVVVTKTPAPVVVTTVTSSAPPASTDEIDTAAAQYNRIADLSIQITYTCSGGAATLALGATHLTTNAEYGPSSPQAINCTGQSQSLATELGDSPTETSWDAGDQVIIQAKFSFASGADDLDHITTQVTYNPN